MMKTKALKKLLACMVSAALLLSLSAPTALSVLAVDDSDQDIVSEIGEQTDEQTDEENGDVITDSEEVVVEEVDVEEPDTTDVDDSDVSETTDVDSDDGEIVTAEENDTDLDEPVSETPTLHFAMATAFAAGVCNCTVACYVNGNCTVCHDDWTACEPGQNGCTCTEACWLNGDCPVCLEAIGSCALAPPINNHEWNNAWNNAIKKITLKGAGENVSGAIKFDTREEAGWLGEFLPQYVGYTSWSSEGPLTFKVKNLKTLDIAALTTENFDITLGDSVAGFDLYIEKFVLEGNDDWRLFFVVYDEDDEFALLYAFHVKFEQAKSDNDQGQNNNNQGNNNSQGQNNNDQGQNDNSQGNTTGGVGGTTPKGLVATPQASPETPAVSSPASSVTVDSDGNIPVSSLEEIMGTDAEVTYKAPNGSVWTINGQDITDPKPFDPTITFNQKGAVPSALVQKAKSINKATLSGTFTIGHDGAFGFTASLQVKFDSKHAGKTVKVYRYDADKDALVACGTAIIAANGTVTIGGLEQGGSYCVVA